MPNHDARAIANEFLRRRNSETWPKQLTVQKLAYMAHGWNLAINKEALIDEAPEAWDNGPVFRSIWNHVRDFGYRGDKYTLVDPVSNTEYKAKLTGKEREVLDHVWRKYSGMTSEELTEMTHRIGTPWYNAYFGNHRNSRLSNEDIRGHYVKLALAGRPENG